MSDLDLDVLLSSISLGDKLQRLARLSPADLTGIERIVDGCLRRSWPRTIEQWIRQDWYPLLSRSH